VRLGVWRLRSLSGERVPEGPQGPGVPDAYRSAGVDYEVLDAAKRRALGAVRGSLAAARDRGAQVDLATVGEPAQVVSLAGGGVLATVLECLGTKSEIAREVEAALGIDRWAAIGQDAVAAIVNDLCCCGALPVSVSAYLATGSAGWYEGTRHTSFIAGWAQACAAAGAAFVGGESPTLAGIIAEGAVDIAGSAIGLVPAGASLWAGSRIVPGDEIVLVGSSGLHANGASLARAVAGRVEGGWAAVLPSGRFFGEAVLDPSVLYVGLVEALQGFPAVGESIHYGSHLTGHGWRKLMRADRELTYRLRELPDVPEVLEFISIEAGLDEPAAYGTLNMGAGFALFADSAAGEAVVRIAEGLGYQALVAGLVEEGPRQVVLEPVGVIYSSTDLELR
jgi:phosphoribosylformylglycinamidine cyclo-ligase